MSSILSAPSDVFLVLDLATWRARSNDPATTNQVKPGVGSADWRRLQQPGVSAADLAGAFKALKVLQVGTIFTSLSD